MTNLAGWSERYPRSGVVVCARRFSAGEVDRFSHWTAPRLSQSELDLLAQSLGAQGLPAHIPEQLRDLASWPMWATAIMSYGAAANTGLELLQGLLKTRLSTAGMSSPVEVEELRAVAGYLAFALWPATSSPISEAIDHLARWRESPGAARFDERSPADLVHRLTGCGNWVLERC